MHSSHNLLKKLNSTLLHLYKTFCSGFKNTFVIAISFSLKIELKYFLPFFCCSHL